MEITIRTDQSESVTTTSAAPFEAPQSPSSASGPAAVTAEPPAGVAERAAALGAHNAGPAPAPPGESSAPRPHIAAELAEPAEGPGLSAGAAPSLG